MNHQVQQIPLDKIVWPGQVREQHEDKDVIAMALSFKAVGQLQPVIARPIGTEIAGIDGKTRCLAAQKLGWKTIAAIVHDGELSESDVVHRQLCANCTRSDLTPVEKARGIKRLIELTGWTASNTAQRLGMSNGAVTRLLALLELPQDIAQQVNAGVIAVSTGYELSKVTDPARQTELAREAAKGELTRDAASRVTKRDVNGHARRRAPRRSKAIVALDGGRSVTISGPALSLDALMTCLEEALNKARQAQARGGNLEKFLSWCREEAKATASAA